MSPNAVLECSSGCWMDAGRSASIGCLNSSAPIGLRRTSGVMMERGGAGWEYVNWPWAASCVLSLASPIHWTRERALLRVGLFTGTGSMHLALLLTLGFGFAFACQLPSEWRPLSEGCRAELAEIIVYAKVLAIHEEPYASSLYNYLPSLKHERAEDALLYAAEVELLCDQAWGSMLEVPAGSRLNLTGLGYFSCQSHTVMENNSYIFFLRWVHVYIKTKNRF